jgi:uncharacterized protein YjbI with pentapeptide repeats
MGKITVNSKPFRLPIALSTAYLSLLLVQQAEWGLQGAKFCNSLECVRKAAIAPISVSNIEGFSILFLATLYLFERDERRKLSHYQAWSMINSAMTQSGSGGRIDALQDLNQDGASLAGLNSSNAYLTGVRLENADLKRANFSFANLNQATLDRAKFLRQACLCEATLLGADLTKANLTGANLRKANLTGAKLEGADFSGANLREAILRNISGWTPEQLKCAAFWKEAVYDDSVSSDWEYCLFNF